MKNTKRLFTTLALTAALGLVACGDDSNPPAPDTGGPDQFVFLDMGVDGMSPDTGVDTMVQDNGVDMAVDTVADDMATTDMAADMAADAPPPDMAADTTTADAPLPADAGTASGACLTPTVLTMPGSGKLTVTGDTTGMTNEFGQLIKCGSSYDFDGQQVYYQVALTAAKKYLITVTPTSSWDVALYVFKDKTCTAATINTECGGSGGDYADDGSSGDAEMIVFTPTASGDFLIAVDSYSTTAAGKFTLTIEEAVTPANDTCASAKTLTFSANKISETGNTLLAVNDVQLTSSDCTGNSTAGPDVFYKVDLTAGATYKFELDGSGFNEVLYLFTGCANVAGTCGTGMGADDWSSSSEELTFKPTTTGTYYIGVAGRGATDSGGFTLTVDEFAPVTNDTCATAKALTLTSGKGSTSGHNIGATDTVNLTSSGCTGDDTEGGDVFHKITLTAGTLYLFTVVPQTGFNQSIYLLSDCTAPTTKCVAGADDEYSGDTEAFTFKPTTTGSYTVAVDSSYTAGATYSEGGYTLTVEALTTPANDACTGAKTLTFTAGAFTETGNTYAATDTVNLTSSDCTGDTTAGADVFYKVNLTAGNAYSFNLDATGFNEVLYLFTSCTNVTGTCGTGMGIDDWSTSSEDLDFVPTTSGTYYLAVDGRLAGEVGTFTLKGTETVTAANNTCASAQALTFSGTPATATASGDTSKGTNSISLTSSGCTSGSTPGYDLFYKVTLTAGTAYTVTLTPDSSFDPALYVFTDCANAESTCGSGWGSDSSYVGGGVETVTITPTTTGVHYIGVDSYSSSEYGTFTLEVK